MGQTVAHVPQQCARQSERRPVTLHGFLALDDGSASEITVLDMSYEGCRVSTAATLSEGQRVRLAVFRHGAVEARVRWNRDGMAGLVFGVDPEPEPPRTHSPRRSRRLTLTGEVALRRPGKTNYRVRAIDVSPEGCRVEFIDRPDIGEHLWIKFEGIEALQAKVRWIAGVHSGLEFVRPIHLAVFDMLVARIG